MKEKQRFYNPLAYSEEMMDRSAPRLSRVRPGGHQLRPEVVSHHQRQRILAAAVALIAERGYRRVTVADIVKRANIRLE